MRILFSIPFLAVSLIVSGTPVFGSDQLDQPGRARAVAPKAGVETLAGRFPEPAFASTVSPPQNMAQSPTSVGAPGAGNPASPSVAQPALNRTNVSVVAGTGVLLHLPEPAATVIAADPSIARAQPASPTSIFLMGVAPGRTTVIATNDAGAAIIQYDITVLSSGEQKAAEAPAAPAGAPVDAAQAAITRNVTGAQNVRISGAANNLILTGTVGTALAAHQAMAIARAFVGEKGGVVDNMTVLGGIQVNVRVRIAEIDRTITRQLGFNWQALGSGGNWMFGVLTGGATAGTISSLLPLGGTPFQGASSLPYQVGAGYTSGTRDINGVIDALAAEQLISILAEPNLTAQSGETASFLAGGEFPIPVAGNTTNGTTTITVEFKPFGVSLALVPTVLANNRVNLRVRPEVSELTTNGQVSVPLAGGTLTIPALTVRRAETTVEMGSGQSFAIAGLLSRTSTDITNALPGIGEVPVLGALFKSNNFQRGESELVIIVTPYIVRPASNPDLLHAPTDGFRPATDLDRMLLGRQLAPGPSGQPIDAGYILK